MEREVWDLYGIRFDGHPDLRRILLYDEFEGTRCARTIRRSGASRSWAEELARGQPHFPTPPLESEDDFERDLHTEHQLLNMGRRIRRRTAR
jgi:NADH-quinone oxidoreductase subunit C